VKLWHLVAFCSLTAVGLGQDPIEARRKVLETYPGFQMEAIERVVAPGAAASTATTPYGDPVTQKHGTTLAGVGTTTISWPELGVYQKFTGKLLGVMYDIDRPMMAGSVESEHLMFDGRVGYSHLFDKSGKGRDQVHVDEPGHRMSHGMFTDVWDPMEKGLTLKGSRIDPTYGNVLIYEGPSGEYEFAKDRDWNCVRKNHSILTVEIVKMIKVGAHWLPAEIKETRQGMDILCSVSYKKVDGLTQQDFSPKKRAGMLWIDNNVYYDVVGGKLVKSKMQPDRTSEYLSWAGMGTVALIVLGGLGFQAHKLFGKSHGSLFESAKGTEKSEKVV